MRMLDKVVHGCHVHAANNERRWQARLHDTPTITPRHAHMLFHAPDHIGTASAARLRKEFAVLLAAHASQIGRIVWVRGRVSLRGGAVQHCEGASKEQMLFAATDLFVATE